MPKRDLDRMRELLFLAEAYELPDDEQHLGWMDLESLLDSMQDVPVANDYFQLLLMRGAGWIEGDHVEHGAFRITNSGYDYLDAVRDENVWRQTKLTIRQAGGNAALEVVKSLALALGKKKIEDLTGLSL